VESSSAGKQEVRQKSIRVETSGGSVIHICEQPKKKTKLVQNLRGASPGTSPTPFPDLSVDTALSFAHLHTGEKLSKVEEELTANDDTFPQDLNLLLANNRVTTNYEANCIEFPATVKSEDFKNSDSCNNNKTSLVKIEEALQVEVYSCKEEVQNDLHEKIGSAEKAAVDKGQESNPRNSVKKRTPQKSLPLKCNWTKLLINAAKSGDILEVDKKSRSLIFRDLSSEIPIYEIPSTETPSTKTSSTETSSTETPSTETPSTETPSTKKPSTETPSTETPSSKFHSTKIHSTKTPSTEIPSTKTLSAVTLTSKTLMTESSTIARKSPSEALEPLTSSNLEASDTWKTGDVVWCLQPRRCWWPCLITPEHMTNDVSKLAQNGPKVATWFHVQFFGPKPLHAWIPNNSIRPYTDPDDVAAWKEKDLVDFTIKGAQKVIVYINVATVLKAN
jgi:hypothetical protein